MSFIENTPEPPYYAVISPCELSEDLEGFPEMAERMMELAKEQEGYIGFEMAIQDGNFLSVSYWSSLDAIKKWSVNAEHEEAKKLGKEKWFSRGKTQISKVEMVY